MGSPEFIELSELEKVSLLLRVMAHPLRLRILDFLEVMRQPQRVSEIVSVCEGVQQSIVSQQLKILRECGLITGTKKGTSVFYGINSPFCGKVLAVIRETQKP